MHLLYQWLRSGNATTVECTNQCTIRESPATYSSAKRSIHILNSVMSFERSQCLCEPISA